MEYYIYLYFTSLPEQVSLEDLEDDLTELLGDDGEVTGSGLGNSGGNLDLEVLNLEQVLPRVKCYLKSKGFGEDTILDINGNREPL